MIKETTSRLRAVFKRRYYWIWTAAFLLAGLTLAVAAYRAGRSDGGQFKLELYIGLAVELIAGVVLLTVFESIRRLLRTRERLDYRALSNEILNAKRSIRILTTFSYIFCDEDRIPDLLDKEAIAATREALRKVIASELVEVEVLVLDPRSDGAIARVRDRPDGKIKERIFENLESLRELITQYPRKSNPNGLRVSVYDAIPQISLIQIDDVMSVSFYEAGPISLSTRIETYEDQPLGKFVAENYQQIKDHKTSTLEDYLSRFPEVIESDFDVNTLVIGGGPAGLVASALLEKASVPNCVVERGAIANNWRTQRWDSLSVVGPNWNQGLPGEGQHLDPDGFAGRDEVVARMDKYASDNRIPMRCGCEVTSLREISGPNPGFRASTSFGRITCRNVIIATGAFNEIDVPEIAQNIPGTVVQLTSATYRNPKQLPKEAVLVVGSGQSGFQIADELLDSGRDVHLCIGESYWWRPRRYRGRDTIQWAIEMGKYDQTVDALKDGNRERALPPPVQSGVDGGKDLSHHTLLRKGVKLYGRLSSLRMENKEPFIEFADNLHRSLDRADELSDKVKRSIDKYIEEQASSMTDLTDDDWPRYSSQEIPEFRKLSLGKSNIRSIIWATGYKLDFSWVNCDAFDESGYPLHRRGVTDVDGLYFLGLDWLYTARSSILSGLGADASHLVRRIADNEENSIEVSRPK